MTTFCSIAQQQFTISGYVRDRATGEDLIGATIFSHAFLVGAVTNNYGFYSLSFYSGEVVHLRYSYVGYKSVRKQVVVDSNIHVNIDIANTIELDGVDIEAEKVDKIQETTKMSHVKLPMHQIESLPAIMGEVDVIKAMQMLPGVQSGNEGSSGMYVRGGGPDQNLILLDGTPVYNASHLFGFFSVFNSSAIKNVELVKGGFPARYGGRLSSVLDINMKEGNTKKFSGEGTIGLVASKLMFEGPIWKEKTSFMISLRRTYIDLILPPVLDYFNKEESIAEDNVLESKSRLGYYFYDINAKVNHKFSDKDRIYLSVYTGDDKLYMKDHFIYQDAVSTFTNDSDFDLKWGNLTSSFRWNHKYNNKLFSNFNLTFSDFKFQVGNRNTDINNDGVTEIRDYSAFEYYSGIRDYSFNTNFDYAPNNNHFIKMGTQFINHTFSPGATLIQLETSLENIDTTTGNPQVLSNEMAVYIEDDVKINSAIKMNVGVHASSVFVNKASYFSIQPRLSVRFLLPADWAMKLSYSKMQQYLHLLTNSTLGLPTDLWVPVTENVKPQLSDQIALGIAKSIKDEYLFSAEAYYKEMKGLITYKEGASFFETNKSWEDMIEVGQGWSYGLELLLHKKVGKSTGWIGYTWSKTDRQFEGLNFGERYPYKYDRRHDISFVLIHKLNDAWEFSTTWVFGTGNAVTLPTVRYIGQGDGKQNYEVNYFDKKNDFRMAPYHRWDVAFKHHRKRRWGEGVMTYGFYNLYNRKNPFYYYFGYSDSRDRVLKRASLFPIIPTISWTFKF